MITKKGKLCSQLQDMLVIDLSKQAIVKQTVDTHSLNYFKYNLSC